jgi:hypothetical protein
MNCNNYQPGEQHNRGKISESGLGPAGDRPACNDIPHTGSPFTGDGREQDRAGLPIGTRPRGSGVFRVSGLLTAASAAEADPPRKDPGVYIGLPFCAAGVDGTGPETDLDDDNFKYDIKRTGPQFEIGSAVLEKTKV